MKDEVVIGFATMLALTIIMLGCIHTKLSAQWRTASEDLKYLPLPSLPKLGEPKRELAKLGKFLFFDRQNVIRHQNT